MLFNSIEFLIFFPVVAVLYFLSPQRARWIILLLASCVFYMWFIPSYIIILLVTMVIDYSLCLWMDKTSGGTRRALMITATVATMGSLFVFKYFNFFNQSLAGLTSFLGISWPAEKLSLVLPIGLSFFSFQALGYVLEVYFGRIKPERHFGICWLFIMFFPQLVAGPIERPQNLLPQFYERHNFDWALLTSGLRRVLWGLFKKMAVADSLAVIVNHVYNDVHAYSGFPLILATFAFAFQIYCDFSSYSDIAIGTARILGFRIMENFDRPYLSASISEFWKRWHISLSSWFKDYLYIPLGGNRVSRPRWQFNLFFTFLVSGLWHGADWTFVIWGALNGFYLVFSIWTTRLRVVAARLSGLAKTPRLRRFFGVIFTFTLILFAWIFFRANSVEDAFYVVANIIPPDFSFTGLTASLGALGLYEELIFAGIPLFILIFVQLFIAGGGAVSRVFRRSRLLRVTAYAAVFILILALGVRETETEFIYFQF